MSIENTFKLILWVVPLIIVIRCFFRVYIGFKDVKEIDEVFSKTYKNK